MSPDNLPAWIGPAEFAPFGAKWVAVRCPAEYAPLVRRAGAMWDPASKRWLVHRRCVGPVLPPLRAAADVDEG